MTNRRSQSDTREFEGNITLAKLIVGEIRQSQAVDLGTYSGNGTRHSVHLLQSFQLTVTWLANRRRALRTWAPLFTE
jgi:hypothetical protein